MNLADWEIKITNCHDKKLDLSIERVLEISQDLNLCHFDVPVITIGGTNGKGSVVALMESIYHNAGFKVVSYTSPHLFDVNERIKLSQIPISDNALCDALEIVDTGRCDIGLTYFEFLTLAALLIFKKAKPDVILLEVGLGGRLDAVNVVEPTISIITSVSIDHTHYLGESIEEIAVEKAGIMRSGKTTLFAESIVPQAIVAHATACHASLKVYGKDFGLDSNGTFYTEGTKIENVPKSTLLSNNVATSIAAVNSLKEICPVSDKLIKSGIEKVSIVGRQQLIKKDGNLFLFDVAHNKASVKALKTTLDEICIKGKTVAIFSMLKDKDIEDCVTIIKDNIDFWCVAPCEKEGSASKGNLKTVFNKTNIVNVNIMDSLAAAFEYAKNELGDDDICVVFGSFKVVSTLLPHVMSIGAIDKAEMAS